MARKVFDTSHFRKTFDFGSKELYHYFPGHMSKGMNNMQRKLKDVDCVLEVHDGRIPLSGRNPNFTENILGVRPHILVLNKVDLADLHNKELIGSKLKREEGISEIVYTNCKQQIHHTTKRVLLKKAIELIDAGPRFHRSSAKDYTFLVIGVPNVGKSSLINALRRTHIQKGKATPVGALSGITRSVMERIKINHQPPIYIYDTPGILCPKVDDLETGMKLALCATMQDHLVGHDMIADYLLYWLNKQRKFSYQKVFNLEEPCDDIFQVLSSIAMARNLIAKKRSLTGGYEFRPDFNRAARIMITAFREGQLGRVNLDMEKLAGEKQKQEFPT